MNTFIPPKVDDSFVADGFIFTRLGTTQAGFRVTQLGFCALTSGVTLANCPFDKLGKNAIVIRAARQK
jgi:hypothetical protein